MIEYDSFIESKVLLVLVIGRHSYDLRHGTEVSVIQSSRSSDVSSWYRLSRDKRQIFQHHQNILAAASDLAFQIFGLRRKCCCLQIHSNRHSCALHHRAPVPMIDCRVCRSFHRRSFTFALQRVPFPWIWFWSCFHPSCRRCRRHRRRA